MSSMLTAQNVESSKIEHPGKCKKTVKLMLIYSDVPKKSWLLFIDLNESYMLQVYFAETAMVIFEIPVFNFSFFKDSLSLSQPAKFHKFLDPFN